MASPVLLQALGNGVIWDQNGNGINGHQVYVYQRGTTTQVTVYGDSGLSSPMSQPLSTGSWIVPSSGQSTPAPGSIPGYVADGQELDFYDATSGIRMPAEPVASGDVALLSATGRQTFTGEIAAPDFAPVGLAGATAASRYVGGTASGHPTSGTFAIGDYIIDQTGSVWICTTAGTPGTWAQGGGLSTTASGAAAPSYGRTSTVGAPTLRDFVSILDFAGSSNGNGTTDDSTIVSAAVTALQTASGGTLYFTQHQLNGSSAATWTYKRIAVSTASRLTIWMYSTVHQCVAGTDAGGTMWKMSSNSANAGNYLVSDVRFFGGKVLGNGSEGSNQGFIFCQRGKDVTVRDLWCSNWGSANTAGGTVVQIEDSARVRLEDLTLLNCNEQNAQNPINVVHDSAFNGMTVPLADILLTGIIIQGTGAAGIGLSFASGGTNPQAILWVVGNPTGGSGTPSFTWQGVTYTAAALNVGDSSSVIQSKIRASKGASNQTLLSGTWKATTSSAGTFTTNNHGYGANQTVVLSGLVGGSSFTPGLTYYVVNQTTNTFQLATAPGGAAITSGTNITVGLVASTPAKAITAVGSTGVFTATAHGYVAGDVVILSGLTGGSGFTTDTPYFVVSPTTNTFQLATSYGGAAVTGGTDISAGNVIRISAVTVYAETNVAENTNSTLPGQWGGAGQVLNPVYFFMYFSGLSGDGNTNAIMTGFSSADSWTGGAQPKTLFMAPRTRVGIHNCPEIESTGWSALGLEQGGGSGASNPVGCGNPFVDLTVDNCTFRYSGPSQTGTNAGAVMMVNDSNPTSSQALIQNARLSNLFIESNKHGASVHASNSAMRGCIVNLYVNGTGVTFGGTGGVVSPAHVAVSDTQINMPDGGSGNGMDLENATDSWIDGVDVNYPTGTSTPAGVAVILNQCTRCHVRVNVNNAPFYAVRFQACGECVLCAGSRIVNPSQNAAGVEAIRVDGTLTGNIYIQGDVYVSDSTAKMKWVLDPSAATLSGFTVFYKFAPGMAAGTSGIVNGTQASTTCDQYGLRVTAASLTLNNWDSGAYVTATGQTITLPAKPAKGARYTVTLGVAGTVTVSTGTASNILNVAATSESIGTQWQTYAYQSTDGSSWLRTQTG